VNAARYATLWHGLHDYYKACRPVDLWTGVPVLDDDELDALARRWSHLIQDHAEDLGDVYPSLVAWWSAQRADAPEDPSERIRQFWTASLDLADELDVASEFGESDLEARDALTHRFDWVEMHVSLKAHYSERRGYDLDPNGKTRTPRTTNEDIRQLVALWDGVAASAPLDVFGVQGAVADWRKVSAEAKQLTDGADPDAVFPDNRELWRVSQRLAIRVQTTRDARNAEDATRGDLVRFSGMKDLLELHMKLKTYFDERRGFDLDPKNGKTHTPRTTNDDVRQLVAIWDRIAASARLDVFGVKGAVADWRAFASEAKQLLKAADPDAVFAKNYQLWRVSQRLAIRGQTGNEEPPPFDFWDALGKNVMRAPERIGDALGVAGDAAGKVVGGAASVAGDAVGGAAKAVAQAGAPVLRPLLIGAGVVGAGVLAIALLRR